MAKHAYVLVITTPAGERHEILVKKSAQVRLEERTGRPILAQVAQSYVGAADRLAYEIGTENGIIPKDLTFDDFLDSDDEWLVDIIPPEVDVAVDGSGNA